MRNRKNILTDLVYINGNLSELQNELSQYSWDIDEPILIISELHFSDILKRGIENKITFEDIEKWANIIECREDLDFENEKMQEIIFELASPEINGKITKESLKKMFVELQSQKST
jgi:hypothetical protein